MGYASDRPVSGGEKDGDGILGFLHAAQFAPSSTNLPGLGFIALPTGPAMMDGNTGGSFVGGMQKILKPISAPKPTPVPVQQPKPISTLPAGFTPGVSDGTPLPALPTGGLTFTPPTPAPATPAPSSQTSQQAQDNSTALAQQAAQAQAAGNTALAKSLTAQSVQWSDVSAAIQNAIGAATSGSADNTMGVAATTDTPAATAKPISKEVVYAGLGAIALLLLLRH